MTKPHPWLKDVPFLVETALDHTIGTEVADADLILAKYQKRAHFVEKDHFFYIHEFFGRPYIGDYIVLAFRSDDIVSTRRCALTISVRGITTELVEAQFGDALVALGFQACPGENDWETNFENATQTIALSVHVSDEIASVGLRAISPR